MKDRRTYPLSRKYDVARRVLVHLIRNDWSSKRDLCKKIQETETPINAALALLCSHGIVEDKHLGVGYGNRKVFRVVSGFSDSRRLGQDADPELVKVVRQAMVELGWFPDETTARYVY